MPIDFFTAPFSNRNRAPFPGGGYFSTAADLAVFAQMILKGGVHDGRRYLSTKAVQQMTSRQTGKLVTALRAGLADGTTARPLFRSRGGLQQPFLDRPGEETDHDLDGPAFRLRRPGWRQGSSRVPASRVGSVRKGPSMATPKACGAKFQITN